MAYTLAAHHVTRGGIPNTGLSPHQRRRILGWSCSGRRELQGASYSDRNGYPPLTGLVCGRPLLFACGLVRHGFTTTVKTVRFLPSLSHEMKRCAACILGAGISMN
jgi:hypothetical protein